jgi:succinate dehydrogenase / fumarate reductase membrane anchor subunit
VSPPVHGLRAWALQRISAVFLLVFTVFLLVHFLRHAPVDFRSWHDWVARPSSAVALGLFVVMLLAHMWVGVRDVIMDYVHPLALRLMLLVAVGVGLLATGIWAALILVETVAA